MAEPISVQCPHCKVKLKLKAVPPAGKKVGCPKCKKPFPVKAPPKKKADEEDFLDSLDELTEDDYDAPEDEDTDELEDEAPVRSTVRSRSSVGKKGAAKGKKGRGKKSSAGPILAIVGGGLAVVALIGGLVWLLMNLAGSRGIRSATGEFIAFAPSDADLYLAVRPADLMSSPLLAAMGQNPQAKAELARFEQQFGFPLTEVEHAFFAIKLNAGGGAPAGNVAGNPMAGGMPGAGPPGMPGGMPGAPMGGMPGGMPGAAMGGMPGAAGPSNISQDSVLVLRLKQPYGGKTLEQISQQSPPKSYKGVSFYSMPGPTGGGYFFGDEKHVVLGEQSQIERIIDRKDQAEDRALVGYFAKDQHITLIATSNGIAAQNRLMPGLNPALTQNANLQQMTQDISIARLDINMPAGVDIKVAVTCKTDAAAQQLHSEATQYVEQLKQQAVFFKMMVPDIDSVINTVQVNLAGTTCTMTASVPSAMIDRLKQSGGPGAPVGSPGFPLSPGVAPGGVSPGAAPPVSFPAGSTPAVAGGSDSGNNLTDVRAAVIRSQATNNLKQVLLALHNHHDLHTTFPPAFSTDASGKPLLSWRVHVLPFLGEKALYDQFHLNEAWDSEHNKTLIARIPATFAAPDEPALVSQGLTRIVVPTGMGMAFEGTQGLKVRDFLDGTSRTLAAVEVASSAAVVWTKPDDLVVDVNMPHQNLTGSRGEIFLAAFADGAVRPIKTSLPAAALKALFTRNGNDDIPPEAFQ